MSVLPSSIARRVALIAAAVFFTGAGIAHFTHTEFFLSVVPPYLPAHLALVYVSGVFEILGGIGVLVPSTRRIAGLGLITLLVAVFPANVHMAMNPALFPEMSPAALYIRLPMQLVLAVWVWWATAGRAARDQPSPIV